MTFDKSAIVAAEAAACGCYSAANSGIMEGKMKVRHCLIYFLLAASVASCIAVPLRPVSPPPTPMPPWTMSPLPTLPLEWQVLLPTKGSGKVIEKVSAPSLRFDGGR